MARTTHRPLRSRIATEESSRRAKSLRNGRVAARNGNVADGGAPVSYEGFVARQLSNVRDIDAAFVLEDDGLVHIYYVVPDFSFGLYKKLQSRERKIEKGFPEVTFDFHVRARQGRKAAEVVPVGARAVFVR